MGEVSRFRRPDFADPQGIRESLGEYIKERRGKDEIPLRAHIDEGDRTYRLYAQVGNVPNLGWALFDANLTMLDCDETTKAYQDEYIPKKNQFPTVNEMMEIRPQATTELVRQWEATKIHGQTHGRYIKGASMFVSYMIEVHSPLPMIIESLKEVCEEHADMVGRKALEVWKSKGFIAEEYDFSRRFLHIWNVAPALSALYDSGLQLVDEVKYKLS